MEKTDIDELQIIRKARKNFIALATAYFLGVFNDNFFKQAICLMAVGIGKSEFQGNATILFAIPFLLFAAPAGWFSDKYSKRSVVVWAKGIEIFAMGAGAYGIIYENWFFIFAMLFIMATQSTLVSPALNGAIPELYPKSYVTKANSIVKLVSTSAILAGIAFAGPMIERKSSAEIDLPIFNESSISEPIAFIETLKIKEDNISKLIVAEISPEYLNLKKEEEQSVEEVLSQQTGNLINNAKVFMGGTPKEIDPKDLLEGKVKIELLTKINNLLKSGKIAEQIKTTDFFTKSIDKINPPVVLPTDFNYVETVISRKYLEKEYSAHLKLIEITKTGKYLIAGIISLVALVGWLVSLGIPKLKAAATEKPFPYWGPLNTIKVIFNIRKDYLLTWTFIGSMFFYSIANLLVLKINSMGVNQFHFSFMDTSLLVVALLVGICIGSIIAGFIATDKGWYKLIPPALLTMGVFSTLVFYTPQIAASYQYFYLIAMMVCTGVGGGLFIIPMESFCQTRPEASRKGEILSAHNFVDFAGILISGFVYYLLEAMFPKQSSCMAFLGVVIIILSIIFFIAFLKVSKKEQERENNS